MHKIVEHLQQNCAFPVVTSNCICTRINLIFTTQENINPLCKSPRIWFASYHVNSSAGHTGEVDEVAKDVLLSQE